MTASTRRPVFDKYLNGYFPDIGAASSIYIPVTAPGFVVDVRIACGGSRTTTAAVLTVKKNGTAMTGGTITATSGGAAGDVFSCQPSAGHYVDVGDYIEIASDGGPANTVIAQATIVVRERSKP